MRRVVCRCETGGGVAALLMLVVLLHWMLLGRYPRALEAERLASPATGSQSEARAEAVRCKPLRSSRIVVGIPFPLRVHAKGETILRQHPLVTRLGEPLLPVVDCCDGTILPYQARVRYQPRRLTPHV